MLLRPQFSKLFEQLEQQVVTWVAYRDKGHSLLLSLANVAERLALLQQPDFDLGVLRHFENAKELLISRHAQKMEAIYQGLATCMFVEFSRPAFLELFSRSPPPFLEAIARLINRRPRILHEISIVALNLVTSLRMRV